MCLLSNQTRRVVLCKQVAGNYFAEGLDATTAAFTKHTHGSGSVRKERATVLLRRWTLGEVVSACATAGLSLCYLEEEPGPKAADAGIPKLFWLVARKM